MPALDPTSHLPRYTLLPLPQLSACSRNRRYSVGALSLRWTFNELSWLFPSLLKASLQDIHDSSRGGPCSVVLHCSHLRSCNLPRRSCTPSQLFRRQSACSPCSQSDALPIGRQRRLEENPPTPRRGRTARLLPVNPRFPPLRTTFDAETVCCQFAERCGVLWRHRQAGLSRRAFRRIDRAAATFAVPRDALAAVPCGPTKAA